MDFKAGSTARMIPAWRNLTSDKMILDSVRGITIPLDTQPNQIRVSPNPKFNDTETLAINTEIERLLGKEVIEQVPHESGEIISPIFVRVKKDGRFRLILNLKEFNKSVSYNHFKMDTLQTITNLMTQNCFMASVDLKDAYYSIPVHRSHRKYLKFFWNQKLYQFTCMPNGLSCCPRLFTKILKPPLTALHKKGHIASNYIDDLYLQGQTFAKCKTNVLDTIEQFDSLGFISHPSKSAFEPSQKLIILGFRLDSVKMTISLTGEKAAALAELCQALIDLGKVKIREVARVLGKIISSLPGVMYGALYYREIEKDKTQALKQNAGNFESYMTLSDNANKELNWWVSNVQQSYSLISHGNPQQIITTDASLIGWGAVFGNQSTGGSWSTAEKTNHINVLELLAVFFGLKCFAKYTTNTHIRIMTDNTTAVATINHMGTCHSEQCNAIGRDIWEWCIARSIWISAAHIPGKLNVQADLESRKINLGAEWMLNPIYLHDALARLKFTPTIDLFASRVNKQFDRYASFRPDPEAEMIDAFTVHWGMLNFYMFPPFSVVSAVLRKILEDKAEGICVLPDWPTRAWYPKALQMCQVAPIKLQPRQDRLVLPGSPEETHPLSKSLGLLICHLSGKN